MTSEIIPLLRRLAKPSVIIILMILVTVMLASLAFDSIKLSVVFESLEFDLEAEKSP